jgi:hypothetical protein
MLSRWWWSVVLVLLAAPRFAVAFTVLWECPLEPGAAQCAWSRAKTTWTMQQTRSAGGETTQVSVPFTPLAPEACAALPGEVWETGYMPERDWCAEVACPGAGAYSLMLILNDQVWSDAPLEVGLDDACAEVAYDPAVTAALPLPPLPAPTGALPGVVPEAGAPAPAPLGAAASEDMAEETAPLPESAAPQDLPALPEAEAEVLSPESIRQVRSITEAYERRQADIRAWYDAQRRSTGTRMARLAAQWQAYRDGMAQLQEAYRSAYQQALEALTARPLAPAPQPAGPAAP